MARLLEIIQSALVDMPDTLTMDDGIYIRGRIIKPDAIAKIGPTDDRKAYTGWHLVDPVQFVQLRHIEQDMNAEDIMRDLLERGWLREDQYAFETLEQIVTAAEVSELWGVKEDTVRDACQRRQIVARKSGGTWLMLYNDAEKRWKKV